MIIDINDDGQENFLQYFDKINFFIEENLKLTNVLVHCYAGISRSSTAVIAFLM